MVTWTNSQDNHLSLFSAQSSSADWKEFANQCASFWVKVSECMQPFELCHLCLEVWIDSGRLIGKPCDGDSGKSNSPFVVQIVDSLILNEALALPDPDEFPEEFESGANAIEARVWLAMRKGSRLPRATTAVQRLKATPSFAVSRQSCDDTGTREEFLL
ncbi:MAG: hypothetical protein QM775_08710 [Pirellulales bacterium]